MWTCSVLKGLRHTPESGLEGYILEIPRTFADLAHILDVVRSEKTSLKPNVAIVVPLIYHRIPGILSPFRHLKTYLQQPFWSRRRLFGGVFSVLFLDHRQRFIKSEAPRKRAQDIQESLPRGLCFEAYSRYQQECRHSRTPQSLRYMSTVSPLEISRCRHDRMTTHRQQALASGKSKQPPETCRLCCDGKAKFDGERSFLDNLDGWGI